MDAQVIVSLSILAKVTLASTDELPEDGVSTPKHVRAILM